MLCFWIPFAIGMIFVIKSVVSEIISKDKSCAIIEAIGGTFLCSMLGVACFIFIGGMISMALPKQEVIVHEYPIYSMSENSFIVGKSSEFGYSEYYYQVDSESGKAVESRGMENTILKTSETPKMTVTKVQFTDCWGDWVSSCWGYSNNYTLNIPQNTIIQ